MGKQFSIFDFLTALLSRHPAVFLSPTVIPQCFYAGYRVVINKVVIPECCNRESSTLVVVVFVCPGLYPAYQHCGVTRPGHT